MAIHGPVIGPGVNAIIQSLPREIFFQPPDVDANFGSYRIQTIVSAGSGRFDFHIPLDFGRLITLEAIGIPTGGAAASGRDIDLTSEYGADGELTTEHSEADVTTLYDFTGLANRWALIDISPVFTMIRAGDRCGLLINHNSIIGTILYLGTLLVYQPWINP